MSQTRGGHFDEIDWLDFAQGTASGDLRELLGRHLDGCAACRDRAGEYRRLIESLPDVPDLLSDDPFVRGAAGSTESSRPEPALRLLADRAGEEGDRVAEFEDRCRAQVEEQLAAGLPLREIPGLRPEHLVAAGGVIRDLFRTDLRRVEKLLADGFAALDLVEDRGTPEAMGAQGVLRTLRGHLLHMRGDSAAALGELSAARPMLDALRFRDLEIAYWSYSRATALHMLTRYDEAIEEIVESIRAYADFEDWTRAARCEISLAIFLSDAGRTDEALAVYRNILDAGRLDGNEPVLSQLYLNMAYDLVLTDRLVEARATYARATRLFKRNGQEAELYRVRVGLADIAMKEGRLEDALALNLELRPELLSRNLHWDTVHRELRIAEILLRLGRTSEARAVCEGLVEQARRVGLAENIERALTELARAEELTLPRIESLQARMRKAEREPHAGGSAA